MNKEYKPFGRDPEGEPLPKTPEEVEKLCDELRRFDVFLGKLEKEPDGERKMRSAIADAKEKGFVIGAKVKLLKDKEVGEVVGYNEATGGFYPGSRYPLIVKFERGTFEYGPGLLKLAKEKEDK